MAVKLSCTLPDCVEGGTGLEGDNDGGGGAGSGFSRLFCRLRFLTCCGGTGLDRRGAELTSETGELLVMDALKASLDGAFANLRESSRVGIAFLIPR